MSDQTLHNEKDSTPRRNLEAASELFNKGTLAHDHSNDRRSSNTSEVTATNVLIVGWDGPDDPSNPKK